MTPPPDRPVQIGRHAIIAVAIALVAPFTGIAWPFALATGIVIGSAEVDRAHGVSASFATRVIRLAAVTGGVLAMLFAGVVVGGLIAFLIVALASFSERLAADASATDRTLARIVMFIAGGIGWIVLGNSVRAPSRDPPRILTRQLARDATLHARHPGDRCLGSTVPALPRRAADRTVEWAR